VLQLWVKCWDVGVTVGKLWGKSAGVNPSANYCFYTKSNTSLTNPNPNLTNSTYPPPCTFSPHLYSTVYPLPYPHPTPPQFTKCLLLQRLTMSGAHQLKRSQRCFKLAVKGRTRLVSCWENTS